MPFNEKKQLDTSQVQDHRGRSTTRNVAVGGGGLGILALIFYLLFGVTPADLNGIYPYIQQPQYNNYGETTTIETECLTGADANQRQDCRLVGYVNSIQTFWTDEFQNMGREYKTTQTVLFSGSTQGACGFASGATGPFYCPSDQLIYIDLSFFDIMHSNFGTQGGPLEEAYVLAHEYGHHVQNLFGVLDTYGRIQDTGPDSQIVFTELQADCLAGIWFNHATETGYISYFTEEELSQALDAAVSVGDDMIQKQTQGYIMPDAWTHGSSQQRVNALIDGMKSGDVETCNSPGWDE